MCSKALGVCAMTEDWLVSPVFVPEFHQHVCWDEISCVRGRSECICLRFALPANHADSIHYLIDPELAVTHHV